MADSIAILGAGRMGLGIALAYGISRQPHTVCLFDLKPRSAADFQAYRDSAQQQLEHELDFLVEARLIAADASADILSQIRFVPHSEGCASLADYTLIYEAVPEILDAKREAYVRVNEFAAADAVVASTTSTFLVSDLAGMLENPHRFMNAHWLNPAHLMPLVEISKSEQADPQVVDQLVSSLNAIGKQTVICSAAAGYIVPRIQALAMNEAARLVEEGVASAEDVDKAVRFGFGPRFAVLGLLEFIDWGGGDILYYASDYLSKAIDQRFAAPEIVRNNMHTARNGLRDGRGFFDYSDVDAHAYKRQRLLEFVGLLRYRDMLPVTESVAK